MTLQSYKERKIKKLREQFNWEEIFGKNSKSQKGVEEFISTLIDEIEGAIPNYKKIESINRQPVEAGHNGCLQEFQDNINKTS